MAQVRASSEGRHRRFGGELHGFQYKLQRFWIIWNIYNCKGTILSSNNAVITVLMVFQINIKDSLVILVLEAVRMLTIVSVTCLYLYLPTFFEMFIDTRVSEMQPDKLDDLSACLMHELMQMVSKVSPDAVARARNQVD